MNPSYRILIIRFSSIGDVVLTTPLLRCIKQQYPDAQIHFVVKATFAPVVEANPHIDYLHKFDGRWKPLMQELNQFSFDAIIDLHKNIRSLYLRSCFSAKKVTFNKLNPEKWLLVNLKTDRLPDKHLVDRYFDAVEPLSITNDGKGCDYFIPESALAVQDKLPRDQPFWAVVAGGRYFTKQIPAHKLIEVCRRIEIPVVLLGGPDDQQQASIIEEKSGTGDRILNLTGKISLNESAAVLQKASCVITPDTGLMHISAALKKPVVSVWGNTVTDFGMYPYYGDAEKNRKYSRIVEVHGLGCRPCTKLGYDKCPRGHFRCMEDISSETIIEAAGQIGGLGD